MISILIGVVDPKSLVDAKIYPENRHVYIAKYLKTLEPFDRDITFVSNNITLLKYFSTNHKDKTEVYFLGSEMEIDDALDALSEEYYDMYMEDI